MTQKYYQTREVSKIAGVHRDTLLRWLREGKIPEPKRNRNNWRIFSKADLENIVEFTYQVKETQAPFLVREPSYSDHIVKLKNIDWDFYNANTNFLNHSIHPYPCKFIPQIPNTLIQELSSIGDMVIDPFAGSGTTLVEALRLGRNVIGVDANPLSALICRVKSTKIEKEDTAPLFELTNELVNRGQSLSSNQLSLFGNNDFRKDTIVDIEIDRWIRDWFDPHVIDELATIKDRCLRLENQSIRELALLAMSSIIVAVSRQDSDTRYVRKEKKIGPGDTFKRFSSALEEAIRRQLELSSEISRNVTVTVISGNILEGIDSPSFDLLVCSPPYPNAFSYHLYHRSRMLWLDMDPVPFKKEEIGSHRKYSSKGKNAATKETFAEELRKILSWISVKLKPGRHACFVIGNSTIRGETIKNDELLIAIAEDIGFSLEANINRNLRATKKSFNPQIGKIKDEHIVILRKDLQVDTNSGVRTADA
ncbi:MAG: MerR family transcriptional regulator [Deltaproteobacteria bacterium]|nr:MerR family transcriptional regulator [Deltaproteobacteria bacterium]